jgi:NDP-sugar pyrophosphorylase family protein
MQAVILAGGKGTRLKPYTTLFPKPLAPVGDFPILEIIIRQLKKYGFNEITISTGHLAELIEAYFGNGSRWSVDIEYVREYTPLNTAGALGLIDNLDDNFLVMNGDILTTLDYSKFFNFHLEKKGLATISLHKREAKIDYGVIEVTPEFQLNNYIEKPSYSFLVSMGINAMNIRCKEYIAKNESIGLPDLMMRMKKEGEKIYCYPSECYWLDIGRVEDYQVAQDKFEQYKDRFLPNE